jgi:hypothetical protein
LGFGEDFRWLMRVGLVADVIDFEEVRSCVSVATMP